MKKKPTQEPRRAPHQLSARGWWAAAKRTSPRITELNISLLASGVAFWAIFSLFPAVIALVTVYGLFFEPAEVTAQVENLLGMVSPEAKALIAGQLSSIAGAQSGALGVGLLLSLAVLLWSASTGMQSLMMALTTSFEQKETRGFVALRARALALTLGAMLFAALVIFAVGVVPPLLEAWLGRGALRWVLMVLQFVLLYAIVVGAIAGMYLYGPANRPAGIRWALGGAAMAGAVFVLATVGFAIYVQNFGNYDATYGTLAGAIIFMFWLYIAAFVVLFGALVNAEGMRQMHADALSKPEGVDRDLTRSPLEKDRELREPYEDLGRSRDEDRTPPLHH
jgi:membrane protein